ncbi:MAG TPA: STAS domain-containing protein, partial [Candidatus Sulfotelmatobacter sp.]|nr:STAS domain-containing protein [Candidatus Sulfotelmatobacter sp.]
AADDAIRAHQPRRGDGLQQVLRHQGVHGGDAGDIDDRDLRAGFHNALQQIVDQGAGIAIIDITGVPTVDTLTAQHLLKTVSAARLMGADCIISGIRPQIAQTIVHLGVELNVISKATLADALSLALRRTGRTVTKTKATERDRQQKPANTAE